MPDHRYALLTAALVTGMVSTASTQAQSLQLISHAFGNPQLAIKAHDPAISADGRFVAFTSTSSGIVNREQQYVGNDVFIYDVACKRAQIVSVAQGGAPADNYSSGPVSLSGDGRYLVFVSSAKNLVPLDLEGITHLHTQVYLFDRLNGSIKLVSAARPSGSATATKKRRPGDLPSAAPSISADGRFVVFQSSSTNLTSEDLRGNQHIFLYDIATGGLRLVSRNVDGKVPNGYSSSPLISADGSHVVFRSMASDLINEPVLSYQSGPHTYIRDRASGVNLLLDRNNAGAIAANGSGNMAISGDGSRVAFTSGAYNLWPGLQQRNQQVFVRDVAAQHLAIATVSPAHLARTVGDHPTLSHNGRYIAFHSSIAGLGPQPGEPWNGLYRIDMLNGDKKRLTPSANGGQENGTSDQPSISADGLRVAFRSTSGNLQGGFGAGVYLSYDDQPSVCAR